MCMHARPHRRIDQLPLRSLHDLRSRWVFASVRPRLARWEHKRARELQRTRGNGGISDGQKHCCFKTLSIRQIVPTKFGKFEGPICRNKIC